VKPQPWSRIFQLPNLLGSVTTARRTSTHTVIRAVAQSDVVQQVELGPGAGGRSPPEQDWKVARES